MGGDEARGVGGLAGVLVVLVEEREVALGVLGIMVIEPLRPEAIPYPRPDHAFHFLRRDPAVQEERDRSNPDAYNFITRQVLPRLKELGASEADINQIMVDNPRRFFEGL